MVAPGTLLAGKFQVERVLGKGGMATVVAAYDQLRAQRVALKLLDRGFLDQPVVIERFLREARASVRLHSEHVGRVLDAGRLDDGVPYLVMEYLEGRDLAAELTDHRCLPVGVAIDYIAQACEALAEAHAAGIVHRDVKPANFFLTTAADGRTLLKVLDFGISKVADDPASDLTQTKVVMGSPPYMSPEQLRATRNVDLRTDVWSLGVVLFQLISGRLPFVGASFADLAIKITSEPAAPLDPSLPAGLVAVIACCLAKDPAARYASVRQLALALAPFADAGGRARIEQLAATAPTSELPATTVDLAVATLGTPPPRPRSRALWIGGIALTVSALGIAIAIAVAPDREIERAPAAPPRPSPPVVAPAPPAPSPPDDLAVVPSDAGVATPPIHHSEPSRKHHNPSRPPVDRAPPSSEDLTTSQY